MSSLPQDGQNFDGQDFPSFDLPPLTPNLDANGFWDGSYIDASQNLQGPPDLYGQSDLSFDGQQGDGAFMVPGPVGMPAGGDFEVNRFDDGIDTHMPAGPIEGLYTPRDFDVPSRDFDAPWVQGGV